MKRILWSITIENTKYRKKNIEDNIEEIRNRELENVTIQLYFHSKTVKSKKNLKP